MPNKYPPVAPVIFSMPKLAPANTGAPAIPASKYIAKVVSPRPAPYVVPIRSTPKVCPVTGTGEPGTGIAICASTARKIVPPAIKVALVRAELRGNTCARRELAGNDMRFSLGR